MPRADADRDLDRLIGRNIQFHRLRKDLSQAKLAARVGVSFQQLQKYEQGANRISASRLFNLARALNVPINAFFEAPGDTRGHAPARTLAAERDEARLLRAYSRIVGRQPRKLLAALAEALSTAVTCSPSRDSTESPPSTLRASGYEARGNHHSPSCTQAGTK
jgi:transcriptional regulator with XRE-family HTH domain